MNNHTNVHFSRSVFLSNLHHAYALIDGTYAFPNNRDGDMLKQAKREVEKLEYTIEEMFNELCVIELGFQHGYPEDHREARKRLGALIDKTRKGNSNDRSGCRGV